MQEVSEARAARAILGRCILPAGKRGAILIAVLVALTIASIILGSLLKIVAAERSALRRQQIGRQADYLAEAGLELALVRLQRDATYAGEIWQVSADELDAPDAATVVIQVAAVAGQPQARRVQSTAHFAPGAARQARESRQRQINLFPQAMP
jgi:hypothetical protein